MQKRLENELMCYMQKAKKNGRMDYRNEGCAFSFSNSWLRMLCARRGSVLEVIRAIPQAESGSEAWGNAPLDRIDN